MCGSTLCSPTREDLRKISEELGLHELAVEDALHSHQRPKLDSYESHLFISVYGAKLMEAGSDGAHAAEPTDAELELIEISIFVTKNALITVRESPDFDIDEVIRRWDANPKMAKYGVPYLLHGLLDYVVDGYFEVLQTLDDRIEALEDDLFDGGSAIQGTSATDVPDAQETGAVPAAGGADARDHGQPAPQERGRAGAPADPLLPGRVRPRAAHRRVVRLLRELVGNVREAHMNQQGFKLNDIMKKITSSAAISRYPL